MGIRKTVTVELTNEEIKTLRRRVEEVHSSLSALGVPAGWTAEEELAAMLRLSLFEARRQYRMQDAIGMIRSEARYRAISDPLAPDAPAPPDIPDWLSEAAR